MNLESSPANNKTGPNAFTLAEILVSMAIVAVIGTIIVATFAGTLRGTSKAQILAVIKQNGQAVLENMDKNIRGADNIVCITPDRRTLVIFKNGIYSRYRITPEDDANGYIEADNPVQPSPPDALSNIDTFISEAGGICNNSDFLDNPVILTDNNQKTGVSVFSGSFESNTASGFKDSVTVSFVLKPGVGIPADISNQIGDVNFQTTIQLR